MQCQQRQDFFDKASNLLQHGKNLIIFPEGTSHWSQHSPGVFKPGAFRLAANMDPEPLIVPIAIANFDKRLRHTTLTAVIKQPFHITNLVDVNDRAAMSEFLCNYQKRFRGYVKQAQKLAAEIDAKRNLMGEINTSFVTLKNIPMSVHG